MPSVRFARDKRGYEYVYLVHVPTRKGRPGKSRVLYWYRTPPGVRIGRKPFDEEVRRTLEAQNPGLTFDWDAIIATPMPPPDMTEYWRERRRLEKAARLERLAEEALEAAASRTEAPESQASESSSDADAQIADTQRAESTDTSTLNGLDVEDREGDGADDDAEDEAAETGNTEPIAGVQSSGDPRRKRRRRGGRRRRGAQQRSDASAGMAGAPQGGEPRNEAPGTEPLASSGFSAAGEPDPQAMCAPDPAPDSQIAAPTDSGSSTSEE